ncbi:MAG: MBL fold metallo-hydrolase [Phycisphaeraceae bacterium JB051]
MSHPAHDHAQAIRYSEIQATQIFNPVILYLLGMAMLIAISVSTTAQAQTLPMAGTQAEGFYRMMVGNFELTAFSDGTSPKDIAAIMSDPPKVRSEFKKMNLAMPYQSSYNVYLIHTGKELVMVDTGRGGDSGQLLKNLFKSGYAPSQIDAVLITHMHGDHVGGLSLDGKRQFPNAVVYAGKDEADFWLQTKLEDYENPHWAGNAKRARAKVNPYIQAGKFKTLDGPTNLFEGIQSLPTPGHTPGHSAYLMKSLDRSILFIGDTIHCAEVQFPNPMLTIAYDVKPDHAKAMRVALFKMASEKGHIIAGPHISFPGLGHLSQNGDGFRWVPVQYQYQVRANQ